MKIIYAQEPLEIDGKCIFLAGPTPRTKSVKSWRPQAIDLFEMMGFDGTLLIPEMRGGFTDNFEYGDQIDWEHEGLEKADIIMFWVPRDFPNMPAFTTNIEFGFWMAKCPEKIVFGYTEDAPKMDYLKYMYAKQERTAHTSLLDTIYETKDRINE